MKRWDSWRDAYRIDTNCFFRKELTGLSRKEYFPIEPSYVHDTHDIIAIPLRLRKKDARVSRYVIISCEDNRKQAGNMLYLYTGLDLEK